MAKQKFINSLFAAGFLATFAISTAFADSGILRASVIDFEDVTSQREVAEPKAKSAEVCNFEAPEKKNYDASVVTVRRRLRVEEADTFEVQVFVKNTGNMVWYSQKSSCLGPRMSLGTDKVRDHASLLYEEGLQGWEAANRVGMDQLRVNPGEIASFTFEAKAPKEADVIKQYMTPVLAGIQWIDDAGVSFEVLVGDTGEKPSEVRKRISYAGLSGSVMELNLEGEKAIVVDRRHQNAYLILDGVAVRSFKVSTGAPDTPTPKGVTQVKLKQDIRVGGKAPHYIMPQFVWFRSGGYGFHALPSLGKPGSGYFWEEARSHIGIPVSHGCVRLLPEDAKILYDFAEVGTTVIITENVEINQDGTYDVSQYL